MSSGCDGKRRSISLDCPNPGSLVEKKKFSSTTGLRSTRAATRTNKTAVTASIHQCAPEPSGTFDSSLPSFIAVNAGRLRIDLNDFHRTFRQRLHERASVRSGHDAIVEDDDNAAVGFCADQTADAL